ncbi:MAG: phospholipase effector Tle1 domain-containing protein, partial [Xanthobacteraceae bacterium]
PGRLRQVWFAGAHSDVGGGYPNDGLSFVPLCWMIPRQRAPLLLSWPVKRDGEVAFPAPAEKIRCSSQIIPCFVKIIPCSVA